MSNPVESRNDDRERTLLVLVPVWAPRGFRVLTDDVACGGTHNSFGMLDAHIKKKRK